MMMKGKKEIERVRVKVIMERLLLLIKLNMCVFLIVFICFYLVIKIRI